MTRRILPLLFLVPAVVFLSAAALIKQPVMLNFTSLPENLLPLADKISGELTDSPPESLKGEPSYRAAPLYGAIVLGEGSGVRFIFSLDGNSLYFDSDQDGDLRNNQPLAAQPAVKGLFRKTLLSFPPVSVQLIYPDDVLQEYRLAVTCDLEKKTFCFSNLGYRCGTVIFLPPDKNLKVAIYDANPPNGIFNDFGKDLLLVDWNRDGEFDISPGSPEKALLAKTLSFAGDVYAIEVPDSGECMDIRQLPVEKQPAGMVAITYGIERDNKTKIQPGEGAIVFNRSGFQVLCSRGPAAFHRGGSCEVFVKNGELTLYDSYNRPWKARFVGNSLMPTAVLTSFPSLFSVGFPLEQNLTTDKKEYHLKEKVVVSMHLVGQAKETYTYFALGDASRQTQPSGKELNEFVFEESKPHLIIKDPAGKIVAEGDMGLKLPGKIIPGVSLVEDVNLGEPEGCYQFTYQIPKETVIPDTGVLCRAISSWDTGLFQGVVTGSVPFSVVKSTEVQKKRGK